MPINYDKEMFEVFARLHPIEAYNLRPDEFCKFLRSEGYDLTDDAIKNIIIQCSDKIITQ